METRNFIGILSVGALVAGMDQLTKTLVSRVVPLNFEKILIPGLVNLVHVTNTGGVFSILAREQGHWQRWFFVGIGIMAICGIFIAYFRTPSDNCRGRVGLSLILGGAVGNLIDRLRLGYVIDFIDVHLGSLHWPAFNIADSAITVGVVLFLWSFLTEGPSC